MKKQAAYGNESISSLKGADRVRKRPAVIFGSDGIEGCEHSIFEILSNSIDEAREGYGSRIIVTRYEDKSFLWITIQKNSALTGSFCFVNYMQAENITMMRTKATNIHLV